MKTFRLLGLALLAVGAIGAFTASAASATATFVLLAGESFPDTFTAKSGASTLETKGGLSIKCTASTSKGELKSASEGVATVTFTGCKESTLGCRSEIKETKVKDAVETILIEGQKLSPAKIKTTKGGVAFKLATPLNILCGTAKDEVKGSVIGEATPINSSVTASKLTFTQSKGAQVKVALSECEESPKPTCAELTATPLEAKLGAAFEGSGFETTDELTFTKMVELKIA